MRREVLVPVRGRGGGRGLRTSLTSGVTTYMAACMPVGKVSRDEKVGRNGQSGGRRKGGTALATVSIV